MEMITRRKANDNILSDGEQNVAMWLRPTFLKSINGTIATDEETIESMIAKLAEYCTSQEVQSRQTCCKY